MRNLRFAPVDMGAVKQIINCQQALYCFGWRPTRKEPASYRGPCPIHGSRSSSSRSLSVTPDEWYCHVCKTGGDVIRLWARIYHITDLEAAFALCRLAGVEPPRKPNPGI